MILYNQLSAEEGILHIDIQVEDKPYFENIYITGVRVDNADTYNTDNAYEKITQEPSKELIVDIRTKAKGEILFITPYVEGAPGEDTPCGHDVCNKAYIYCDTDIKNKGISFLKELGAGCQIPRGFIDFILRAAALDLSLQTCNYEDAIKYWNLIKGDKIKAKSKNCGCHGTGYL